MSSFANKLPAGILFLAVLFLGCGSVNAQTNLLLNTGAEDGTNHWQFSPQSSVENFNGQNVFVIRRTEDRPSGGFGQDVTLKPADQGKFALFIGFGSSERVNVDGAITGLPYLYGYMMESTNPNGGVIKAHLQGQRMLGKSSKADEWVKMYGVFKVPDGTVGIRFFLEQASRKGVPYDGSAARFDNVGLYLFETEKQALDFARVF